jgi:hypothetical protein
MSDPVLDVLTRLRERPAMYIGRHSAEDLFLFLVGYTAALQDHSALDISEFSTFIEGLYAKYGYGGGGHSWAWVLGQEAGGDAAGLDLFFKELAAFQNRQES